MKRPKEKLDALLFYYLLAAQASSFLIHHSEHNKLGHTWYAAPHFAALVWLMGYHAIPLYLCPHS